VTFRDSRCKSQNNVLSRFLNPTSGAGSCHADGRLQPACKCFVSPCNNYSKHGSNIESTGTQNGGNNFPGVARPFGMVKLGPDLLVSGTDSYSGYLPNGNFSGFSMMHEQGTGGAPKYGTVAQLPLIGKIGNPLSSITVGRSGTDQGSVGYYKAVTSDGVVVEMAAASRAGMYQYTFPDASTGNNILIDISHVLPSFRGQGLGQGYAGGDFAILEDGHYEASGIYNNGWNRSPNWKIYSCTCKNIIRKL